MYSLNKAGLLASTIVALLVITSCSDSGTSTTGVTPLSRDAAEAGAINNAALKREDHDHGPQGHEAVGIAAPGQGEGLGHQHGEAGNVVTTTTVLALAAIPTSTCGNLIQEAGEQCDAGLSGSATCTANCELKTGKGGEIVAENFCGDGTRDAGEDCDDGNADNTDSCTQYCKKAVCGDGYTQPSNGEQCDDKNKVDGDGCNTCQKQATTVVTITTVTTVTNTGGGTTTVVADGNGGGNPTKACPDGGDEECKFPGQRFVDEGKIQVADCPGDESCGTFVDILLCSATCQKTVEKSSVTCNDGYHIVNNVVEGLIYAGCGCEHDSEGNCLAAKPLHPEADAICGNALLEAGEECDDGNQMNGDSCSSSCQVESTTPVLFGTSDAQVDLKTEALARCEETYRQCRNDNLTTWKGCKGGVSSYPVEWRIFHENNCYDAYQSGMDDCREQWSCDGAPDW